MISFTLSLFLIKSGIMLITHCGVSVFKIFNHHGEQKQVGTFCAWGESERDLAMFGCETFSRAQKKSCITSAMNFNVWNNFFMTSLKLFFYFFFFFSTRSQTSAWQISRWAFNRNEIFCYLGLLKKLNCT